MVKENVVAMKIDVEGVCDCVACLSDRFVVCCLFLHVFCSLVCVVWFHANIMQVMSCTHSNLHVN